MQRLSDLTGFHWGMQTVSFVACGKKSDLTMCNTEQGESKKKQRWLERKLGYKLPRVSIKTVKQRKQEQKRNMHEILET